MHSWDINPSLGRVQTNLYFVIYAVADLGEGGLRHRGADLGGRQIFGGIKFKKINIIFQFSEEITLEFVPVDHRLTTGDKRITKSECSRNQLQYRDVLGIRMFKNYFKF